MQEGGHESELASGPEHTPRQPHQTVAAMAERQGTGASNAGERLESNSLVRRNVAPEGLTNKTSFKQRARVAGATDETFKVLLGWVRAREPNALAIIPESSSMVVASRLAQHVHASLLMSRGRSRGTLHCRQYTGEKGLEAWRRLVQTFDPRSAHANPKLLSKIFYPLLRVNLDNISSLTEERDEMVRQSAARTYVEQFCHKSDSMDVYEMASDTDEMYDVDGAKSTPPDRPRARGKSNAKDKAKAPGRATARTTHGRKSQTTSHTLVKLRGGSVQGGAG